MKKKEIEDILTALLEKRTRGGSPGLLRYEN
jgi:hypothetical protein